MAAVEGVVLGARCGWFSNGRYIRGILELPETRTQNL